MHVAREMKATFMTLTWMDEIKSMKNEIWRMEMKKGVLKREIEKVQRVLEKVAVRWVVGGFWGVLGGFGGFWGVLGSFGGFWEFFGKEFWVFLEGVWGVLKVFWVFWRGF